jgi:type IV pilus assembly protein PilO
MAIGLKGLTKLKWYYQVLIVAVVCGGLLAGVWYQFLTPIQADIETKLKQIDDLQKTIAKSLQQQKQLAQIKKEAIELQAQLEMLKMILPLEKETDQLLITLQEQATMSGLQVKRVSPRPAIDREVYMEWPIDLEVVGTYHNVGAFLDRIRQLPRIMNITGLKLQSRASSGDAAFTSSVGATYTATTFIYKDEPIVSTAPPAKSVK